MVPDKPKAPLPAPPPSTASEAHTSRRPDKLSQQGRLLETALLAAAAAVLEHAQELDDSDQRWVVGLGFTIPKDIGERLLVMLYGANSWCLLSSQLTMLLL